MHATVARRKGDPTKAKNVDDKVALPVHASGSPGKKGKVQKGSLGSHCGVLLGAAIVILVFVVLQGPNGMFSQNQRKSSTSASRPLTGTTGTKSRPDTLARDKNASKRRVSPERETTTLEIYHSNKYCTGKGINVTIYEASFDKEISVPIPRAGVSPSKSMRVIGPGELRLLNQEGNYVATIVELEGCYPIFPYPPIVRGTLAHPDPKAPPKCLVKRGLQAKFATADVSEPHTRIVFSAESSDYFGYQTYANAFAFLNSSQTEASWLRLLTCETPDDLSATFPTFSAPRSPYSKRYGPINKPDVIDKWFHSECDAPDPDDIIVVIDPDNFLLKDVQKWTSDVRRKKAVGQAAYYNGMKLVDELWREVCQQRCGNSIDAVGVPYIVKAEDLKEIAPLWRKYSMIIKERVETDKAFKEKYKALNIEWAAEMFGYNMACAHLSIKTDVVRNLQARDVDASIPLDKADHPAMIHMGRAWFPNKHANLAEKWRHTDGEAWKYKGIQVWCKCNNTASTIMPWPVPDGLDLQSYHTLRLMHDAIEHFGKVPENEEYRHKPPNGYYWTKS